MPPSPPLPPPAATAPGKIRLAAVALGLVALAIYANSFSAPFVFDDLPAIRDNPTIRTLAGGFFPPAGSGLPVSGRPLVNFSLAVNFAISGTEVWSYHLVNLAIHLAAALALFGLVRRTLLRHGYGGPALALAFFSALLWLAHPLATEAVTYTVERTESLMALFYLLTLYAFARSVEPAASRGWPWLAVGACALGMVSKEVMVSAPLLVLLYDRTFVSGGFGPALRKRAIFYSGLAATWLLLGLLVLATTGRGGTAGFTTEISVADYARTQGVAIARYLALSVWPRPLVFDYGTDVVRDLTVIAPCALLVGALAGATIFALRRWPAIGFLGVAFFAVLAPSSSVVPIATQTIAEHRMYLPLAAVVTLIVLGGYRWLGARSYLPFAIAAACLAFGTVLRNADYRSAEAIWRDTVAKHPQNARAQCGLADALFAADRVDEALPFYAEAIRLRPDYAEARVNFGSALLARNRAAEAISELEAALRLEPTWAKAHHNLANALLRVARAPEAIAHYAEAARLRPDDVTNLCDWGNALVRTGNLAGAIKQYEEAIRREPAFAMAHSNLANALAQSGRLTEAIARYETALRLAPDYAEGHNNFGGALAQSGRFAEAITQFQTALRLRPDYPSARDNLGKVYLALGDHAAAEKEFARARRGAPAR
jgi:tetratricopeptide (TPR) repeat protein